METTAETALFCVPSGILLAVTFAGHGEIKIVPIFSGGRPVFLTACLRASRAATSTGALKGSTWSIRLGNRTRISLVTAGQAELITGFKRPGRAIYFRVASETSSAA